VSQPLDSSKKYWGRLYFPLRRPAKFHPIQIEYEKWLATLERALFDPLGGLIDYGSAARKHQNVPTYLDDLLKKLREAAVWRNTICHGSWRAPDEQGAFSSPLR
jgi:hypothetical protein